MKKYKIDFLHILLNIKKFLYYLVECVCQLVFVDGRYCFYVKSKLVDNETIYSWHRFLVKPFQDFKNKGYKFSHILETNTIIFTNIRYIIYDFYIKHNMHAVDWKFNMDIAKIQQLINSLDKSVNHPLFRKYSNVPIIDY